MAAVSDRWGYSRIDAKRNCGYSSMLYLLGSTPSKAMWAGTAQHILAQNALMVKYSGGEPLPKEKADVLREQCLSDPGQSIDGVLASVAEIIGDDECLALDVEVDLTAGPVSGAIDVIATCKTAVHVIDLKMGEADTFLGRHTEQLGLYRDLCAAALPETVKNSGGIIKTWVVTQGNFASVDGNLGPVGSYLARAIETVEDNDYDPNPGGTCADCLYMQHCKHAYVVPADSSDAERYVAMKVKYNRLEDEITALAKRLRAAMEGSVGPKGSSPRIGDVSLRRRHITKYDAASFLLAAEAKLLTASDIASAFNSVKTDKVDELNKRYKLGLIPETGVTQYVQIETRRRKKK